MSTIDFLKDLCPVGTIEFNDLQRTYRYKEAMQLEKDVYFLACIEDQGKRNGDDDVIFKNYFVCDFDIREHVFTKSNDLLDDETLMMCLQTIKEKLLEGGYGDRKYCVFSGNGFHFYYVGKGEKYTPKAYADFVEYHYTQIDKIFGDNSFGLDHSCKNIGRILRLPGSKNYKRTVKYGLPVCECRILETQAISTDKFESLELVAQKKAEADVINQAAFQLKHSLKGVDNPVLEEIMRIDIFELIAEYNGIKPWKDMKHLASPKDGSAIGAFVQDNILYMTGSRHFKDTHAGYNPFSFVKIHYGLDNKGTFEWFLDKYPRLKDYKPKPQIIEANKIEVDFQTILPFTWGTKKVDRIFGRYDIGCLNILAGESGSGKTEQSFFQARENAKKHKVCYISLEMMPDRMIRRFAMKRACITKQERSDKTMSMAQKQIMVEAIKKVEDIENLKIIGIKEPTLDAVKQTILEYHSQGYYLFYVDNLGFITCAGKEIEYTTVISRELKQLTNDYPLTINLIHHFNKGNSNDRNAPRGLASLRSSGKLENDADNIFQIWRDLDPDLNSPEARAEVTFLLQKDREYGEPSIATVYFFKGEYVDDCPFFKNKGSKPDDPF